MYNLIGDSHGHSEPLARLLDKLGYAKTDGVFRHAESDGKYCGGEVGCANGNSKGGVGKDG